MAPGCLTSSTPKHATASRRTPSAHTIPATPYDDHLVHSADFSAESQRFLDLSSDLGPCPIDYMDSDSDSDNPDVTLIHRDDRAADIAKKLERLVKSAYIQTQAIVAANKLDPALPEKLAIFQYIILHWTVLLGHSQASLKRFTVYDFVNGDTVREGWTFKVRHALNKPDEGTQDVTVSEWLYGVLGYYFSIIRPEWRMSATDNADSVDLPFPEYSERTTHFLVNSRGNHDFNCSKAVARFQTKRGTAKQKEHIQRADVQRNPGVIVQLTAIMAAQDIPSPDDELVLLEGWFPVTKSIHPATKLPSEVAIRKKLQQREPGLEKIPGEKLPAEKKARSLWESLRYRQRYV
jgi:hypothetical protein